MSEALSKISITYSSTEDRLVIALAAGESGMLHIWLTRRFVKGLWEALQLSLKQLSDMPAAASPEVRDAMVAMRHQEVMQDGVSIDQSRTKQPVPEEALAINAKFSPGEGGMSQLALASREKTFTINLDENTLHAFCHMLIKATESAGWDLGLQIGDGNVVTPGGKVH